MHRILNSGDKYRETVYTRSYTDTHILHKYVIEKIYKKYGNLENMVIYFWALAMSLGSDFIEIWKFR